MAVSAEDIEAIATVCRGQNVQRVEISGDSVSLAFFPERPAVEPPLTPEELTKKRKDHLEKMRYLSSTPRG